jgi:basic amino acid/polyamine antiporter, APA family
MDVGTPKTKREPPCLIRGLGLWAATAIVIGGMIGQAVFLVASDMSREVGSLTKVLVAWIVGGVIVLFGSFCYGELGAAMPEAGGDYVYQSRGLSPFCGFLYGWTSSVIMRPGSAAIIAAGLVRFVGFLLPRVTQSIFTLNIRLPLQPQPYQFAFTYAQPLAALAVVIVAAMNYLGVRTVGRFQTFLTALKLVAVALILGLGFAGKNATGVNESLLTLPHGTLVAFLTGDVTRLV